MHKSLSLVTLPTLAVPNFVLTLTLFVTPLSQPTPTDADLLLQMACPKQCPPISYPNVPVFFTNPLLHCTYHPCNCKTTHLESDTLPCTYICQSLLRRACPVKTLDLLLTLPSLWDCPPLNCLSAMQEGKMAYALR